LTLNIKGNPMSMKLAALVGGVILAAGCAHPVSVEDLNAVRQIAQGAQTSATDAQRIANEARQLAQTAQSTANQALSAAQDAQACCDANSLRIDRMFEEMQQK
jgi:methyl-accepting chemotaxis protein